MRVASTSSYIAEAAQDLRVAMRRMRRAPAIALAIVLTIGLGLGAAAAIVTTFEAALVEPLPYAEAERLVWLSESRMGSDERSPISATDWRVYGVVAAGVLTCALIATLGPALRAGSVNLGVIMRQD